MTAHIFNLASYGQKGARPPNPDLFSITRSPRLFASDKNKRGCGPHGQSPAQKTRRKSKLDSRVWRRYYRTVVSPFIK
jgi:hypothetical protein